MADVKQIKQAVKAYFAKDLDGTYASYRAVQASFALLVADDPILSEKAQGIAFQAIAASIEARNPGDVNNTGIFGAKGWILGFPRGSELYRALTKHGDKVDQLNDQISAKHATVLGELKNKYGKGDSPTFNALISILTNILNSKMEEQEKEKVIDLWVQVVQIFMHSNEKPKGDVAQRIAKTKDQHVARLSQKTARDMIDSLTLHGASYIKEYVEQLARIPKIKENIDALPLYFGMKDRLLDSLQKVENKNKPAFDNFEQKTRTNRAISVNSLRDHGVRIGDMKDELATIEAGIAFVRGRMTADVQNIKANISKYKIKIDALSQEQKEFSGHYGVARAQQLGLLIKDLEEIESSLSRPVVGSIENRISDIYASLGDVGMKVVAIADSDKLVPELSKKIKDFMREIYEAKGDFNKSPDWDNIKGLLHLNLVKISEELDSLVAEKKEQQKAAINFDDCAIKLNKISMELSHIEGGIKIQGRVLEISEELLSIKDRVETLQKDKEFSARESKDQNSRSQRIMAIVREVSDVEKVRQVKVVDEKATGISSQQLKKLEEKYSAAEVRVQAVDEKVKTIEIEDSIAKKIWSKIKGIFSGLFSSKSSSSSSVEPLSVKSGVGHFEKLTRSDEESDYHKRVMESEPSIKNMSIAELEEKVKKPSFTDSDDKYRQNYKLHAYYLLLVKISDLRKQLESKNHDLGKINSLSGEINQIIKTALANYSNHIAGHESSRRFRVVVAHFQIEFQKLEQLREGLKQFGKEGVSVAELPFDKVVDRDKIHLNYLSDDRDALNQSLLSLISEDKDSNRESKMYYIMRKLLGGVDKQYEEIFGLEKQLRESINNRTEPEIQNLLKQIENKSTELTQSVIQFDGSLVVIINRLMGRYSAEFGLLLKQFKNEIALVRDEKLSKVESMKASSQQLMNSIKGERQEIIKKFIQLARANPERATEEQAYILEKMPALKADLEAAKAEALTAPKTVEPVAQTSTDSKSASEEKKMERPEKPIISDEQAYRLLEEKSQSKKRKQYYSLAYFNEASAAIKDMIRLIPKAEIESITEQLCSAAKKVADNKKTAYVEPPLVGLFRRCQSDDKFIISPCAVLHDQEERGKAVETNQFDRHFIEAELLWQSAHSFVMSQAHVKVDSRSWLDSLQGNTLVWLARMALGEFDDESSETRKESALRLNLMDLIKERANLVDKMVVTEIGEIVSDVLSEFISGGFFSSKKEEAERVQEVNRICKELLSKQVSGSAEQGYELNFDGAKVDSWVKTALQWRHLPEKDRPSSSMISISNALAAALDAQGKLDAKAEAPAKKTQAEIEKGIKANLVEILYESNQRKGKLLQEMQALFILPAGKEHLKNKWEKVMAAVSLTDAFLNPKTGCLLTRSQTWIIRHINTAIRVASRLDSDVAKILLDKKMDYKFFTFLGEPPQLKFKADEDQASQEEKGAESKARGKKSNLLASKKQRDLDNVLDLSEQKVEQMLEGVSEETVMEVVTSADGQQQIVWQKQLQLSDKLVDLNEREIKNFSEQVHYIESELREVKHLVDRVHLEVDHQQAGINAIEGNTSSARKHTEKAAEALKSADEAIVRNDQADKFLKTAALSAAGDQAKGVVAGLMLSA